MLPSTRRAAPGSLMSERQPPTREPITPAMRRAFKANAPAALARRSNTYLFGIASNVVQWLVISSVALTGLYHWGWTPAHMLVVFVAGIAAAIVADFLKWLLARRSLLADYQKMRDDRLVWQIVMATRVGIDEIEKDPATRPGVAIAMDLVLGALGVWLLLAPLGRMGLDPATLLAADGGLRMALLGVCAAPLVSLVASTLAASGEQGGHDELEFRAGGRGIGLLFIAVPVMFGQPDTVRSLMLFFNYATLVLGVVSVFGVYLMYSERAWLRAHLGAQAKEAGR
jgi:hypothetical protein